LDGPLPPRSSVIPSETAAKMPSYSPAVEWARTERRIGQRWEATRAPTQWPRPINKGDASACFGIPFFIHSLAACPASGEAPGDKSWGCGGKPLRSAQASTTLLNRATSHNACIIAIRTYRDRIIIKKSTLTSGMPVPGCLLAAPHDVTTSRRCLHETYVLVNRLASLIERSYLQIQLDLQNHESFAIRRDQYATIVLGSQVTENKVIHQKCKKPPGSGGFR